MKKPERLRPLDTERVRFRKLNDLVDFCASLDLSAGRGIVLRKSPAGTTISTGPQKRITKRSGEESEDCSGGEVKVLGSVVGEQNTDEWDRATDDCPVRFVISSPPYWNPTLGAICCRERTFESDRCGKLKNISGEGDEIVLIPTESCEA